MEDGGWRLDVAVPCSPERAQSSVFTAWTCCGHLLPPLPPRGAPPTASTAKTRSLCLRLEVERSLQENFYTKIYNLRECFYFRLNILYICDIN